MRLFCLLEKYAMKIRKKIITGFLCIALLVGVFGYVSIGMSQKVLKETIGQSYLVLANNTMQTIDRQLHRMVEQIQIYSRGLARDGELAKLNQEFEQLENIQQYIDLQDKAWVAESQETITDFMANIINSELSEELREELELRNFHEEKQGHNVFAEVFVTNKFGVNVAQMAKTSDYYQADEQWWQDAKDNGLHVSEFHYDKSSGIYSVDVCVAINDKEENFLGVIKAVLNIQEIINILKKEEEQAGSMPDFKLLTKDKRVIYSTKEYEVFGKDSKATFYLNKTKIEKEHPYVFATKGPFGDEVEKIVAHAQSKGYRDFEGLGWILMLEHETAEVFAPIARMKKFLLIITTVALTLSIAIGLFISHSICHPMKKLMGFATQIGNGNLNARVEIYSEDEFGDLANSFNKMAQDLRMIVKFISGPQRNNQTQTDKTPNREKVEVKN